MAVKDPSSAEAADAQHRIIRIPEQYGGGTFQRTQHPDARWFGNAGLGLFLHWGISCMGVDVDISWGMIANTSWDRGLYNRNKVSPAQYYSFAKHFNPDRYDPDKYLAAAARAGFRYAVLTTKHHDGYTLWPSAHGQMGTHVFMGGRDLVKPFVDACRKNGLKVGLYYSPPDFFFNREYMDFGCVDNPDSQGGWYHQPTTVPPEPAGWPEKYARLIRGQVTEILTRYGTIDMLFFDGGPAVMTMEELRAMQPGMVISPRMHGYGDYDTIECRLPQGPCDDWWELCERWNIGPWGCTIHDTQYKSLAWMLERFALVRGWGGNYLINCPPDAHGEMPEVYYRRMEELGAWMAPNGQAVVDVDRGPHPEQSNVPVTVRGNTWYLLISKSANVIPSLTGVARPASVTRLGDGAAIRWSMQGDCLTVDLPMERRTGPVDAVAVRWNP